jgi:2-oxoglutarate ferredoxin oxidoreductase subunit alpha
MAFDLAEKYRNPVVILGDALLGQMKEPIILRAPEPGKFDKSWILTGAKGRKPRFLKSLYLNEGDLTEHNWKLFQKYQQMKAEILYDTYQIEDADMVVVSFGSVARIIKSSIKMARDQGMKVGLFRPKTLYPYPEESLKQLSQRVPHFFVVELNTGQMVEDVKLSVDKGSRVDFYGRPPGSIPTPNELFEEIKKVYR